MENIPGIIEALSSASVQQFLRDHESDDVKTFVLKHKQVSGIPAGVMADQILGRKKAKEKLPDYYKTTGIIYPPMVNLEQTSSEVAARYKSSIIRNLYPEGKAKGADLTGGFGVDTFFLGQVAESMDYIEPQKFLLDLAQHNHAVLEGRGNIQYHLSTAERFLSGINQGPDFFYADPSRRSRAGKKIHALSDSEPDIPGMQNEIFKKAKILLLKTSPLLDIQAAINDLLQVSRVFVISVGNECKEVLYLCDRDFRGTPVIEAVNLSANKPRQIFEFTFPEEREAEVVFSDPLQYLYEPNASILKAGAFKIICRSFNLQKIQTSTHLYTSESLSPGFPGKIFIVEKVIKGGAVEITKYFPDGKANITTRNYPLSPEALKKKTGLKDGGDRFLIGFSGQRKKFLVAARRLQP